MPRPKSFLQSLSIDIAQKRHPCQHNPKHTILKGDKRLKLKVDRTYEHFCIECAVKNIESDITKLQELKRQLLDNE